MSCQCWGVCRGKRGRRVAQGRDWGSGRRANHHDQWGREHLLDNSLVRWHRGSVRDVARAHLFEQSTDPIQQLPRVRGSHGCCQSLFLRMSFLRSHPPSTHLTRFCLPHSAADDLRPFTFRQAPWAVLLPAQRTCDGLGWDGGEEGTATLGYPPQPPPSRRRLCHTKQSVARTDQTQESDRSIREIQQARPTVFCLKPRENQRRVLGSRREGVRASRWLIVLEQERQLDRVEHCLCLPDRRGAWDGGGWLDAFAVRIEEVCVLGAGTLTQGGRVLRRRRWPWGRRQASTCGTGPRALGEGACWSPGSVEDSCPDDQRVQVRDMSTTVERAEVEVLGMRD